MITFRHVDNEQPWAWRRKATCPSLAVPNLSATNTLFPPSKHQPALTVSKMYSYVTASLQPEQDWGKKPFGKLKNDDQ